MSESILLCLLSLFAFNQDLPPDAPSTGFLYLLPDKLYSGHNLLKPSEHYHPLRTLMDSLGSRFRMFFLYFRIWNCVNRHDDVTHQLFSCASLCRLSPTLHQLWLAELRLNFWASLFFPFFPRDAHPSPSSFLKQVQCCLHTRPFSNSFLYCQFLCRVSFNLLFSVKQRIYLREYYSCSSHFFNVLLPALTLVLEDRIIIPGSGERLVIYFEPRIF